MENNRCLGCMKIKQNSVCEHCGYDGKANAPHHLPAGSVLKGQYLVGRVLGQGGFGITYLGWDSFLKIPVAIKEYYPSGLVMRDSTYSLEVTNIGGSGSSRFETNRNRFLREAQALAKLGDVPQVVHVRGFFPENGTAYIVMEYLQGTTLRDLVKARGKLSVETMLSLMVPVLEGLQQVHGAGLIHRDISPDNIMVLPDGSVKLLDFGAVRDFETGASASAEAILKHGYAPPEQYQRRGELGPEVDIYALCGTVYYCLTGQVPPDAPERMMDGVSYGWEEIPGLHAGQREALERGTALMAQERLASAAELKQLLTAAAAEEKPEPKPGAAPARQSAKKRGFGKWLVPVVLVPAVVCGILLVTRNGPQTDNEDEAPTVTAPPETTQPTTELPTEPETQPAAAEEYVTFPAYVTYTDDGMVLSGEGLELSVDNGRYIQLTAEPGAEAFASVGDAGQNGKRTFESRWDVTLDCGDTSYSLSSVKILPHNRLFPEVRSYARAMLDGSAVNCADDIHSSSAENGVYIRCEILDSGDPGGTRHPFDCRLISKITVEAEDAVQQRFFRRTYVLQEGQAPEAPEEEPIEDPYPRGNFTEHVTVTRETIGKDIWIHGDGLDFLFTNNWELTVTVGNLYIEDSYSVTTRRGDQYYQQNRWFLEIVTDPGKSLFLESYPDSQGSGGTYTIKPDYMIHKVWLPIGENEIATEEIVDAAFSRTEVQWHCNVPTAIASRSVKFDPNRISSIRFYAYDMVKNTGLTRIYSFAEE